MIAFRHTAVALLAAGVLALGTVPARAQTPAALPTDGPYDRIALTANRSRVVPVPFDITRIAVTNPAVADAVVPALKAERLDTLTGIFAIGQGPNTQTVLRMAHFYSALAGNGTAPEPHLALDLGPGPGGVGADQRALELLAHPGRERLLHAADDRNLLHPRQPVLRRHGGRFARRQNGPHGVSNDVRHSPRSILWRSADP